MPRSRGAISGVVQRVREAHMVNAYPDFDAVVIGTSSACVRRSRRNRFCQRLLAPGRPCRCAPASSSSESARKPLAALPAELSPGSPGPRWRRCLRPQRAGGKINTAAREAAGAIPFAAKPLQALEWRQVGVERVPTAVIRKRDVTTSPASMRTFHRPLASSNWAPQDRTGPRDSGSTTRCHRRFLRLRTPAP